MTSPSAVTESEESVLGPGHGGNKRSSGQTSGEICGQGKHRAVLSSIRDSITGRILDYRTN